MSPSSPGPGRDAVPLAFVEHEPDRVYRRALEQGITESVYRAVADEAVAFKDIPRQSADGSVGRSNRVREHFG
jgi:hypothetical protein